MCYVRDSSDAFSADPLELVIEGQRVRLAEPIPVYPFAPTVATRTLSLVRPSPLSFVRW